MSAHARVIEPTSGIRGYLARVRRRQLTVEILRATTMVGGALALAFLLLLLAAPLFKRWSAVRTMAWIIGAGAAATLLTSVSVSLARLRKDLVLANLVGRRRPHLRSDLLSTIELLGEPSAQFSPSLYAALANQTWLQLHEHSPSQAVPATALLRPGAIMLVVAALGWATVGLFNGEALHRSARILVGLEHEAPSVAPERLVRDLSLRYEYPSYMARDARLVSGSTGDITAPPGTLIEVRANLAQPGREAAMVVSSTIPGAPQAHRIQLHLTKQRGVRGVIRASAAAHYHFELIDRHGQRIRDPAEQRIEIEPDLSPEAALRGRSSAPGSEVGALQRIDLAYSAKDDWGLSRIELAWQRDGGSAERLVLWEPTGTKEQQRHFAGRYAWDLERLDLAGGGRVSYWIEATDNDTVSGPKRSRSQVHYLVVFSAEERHDRTLAHQRQLLDGSLELLSDRLLLGTSEPPATTQRLARARAFKALYTRQSRFSDGVRELRSQMDSDHLVSPAVLREVASMQRRLHALLRKERRALARIRALTRKGSVSAREITALRRHNTRTVEETERDALLLASLLDEQRLQSVASAARRLKATREHLRQLLEQYRKTRDPRVKRAILAEIARMQRQLDKLAAQMARLRGTIPDEYLNAEAVQRLDMASDLGKLKDLVQRDDLAQLEKALESLDDKLARMDGLLQGNLADFRSERLNERERAYGKMLDQLHEMESAQRTLAKKTGTLNDRYRKRGSRMLRSDIEPRLREQLSKIKQLGKQVDEVKQRPLEPYHSEQLERIERWTGWLREAVEQSDLSQSLNMARRVHDGLKRLKDELQEDTVGMFVPWRRRQQKTVERLERAQGTAEEIEKTLDGLFPSPETLLQPAERAQLRELRKNQHGLQRRVSQLLEQKEDTKAVGQQLLGPKQRAALEQSRELMGDASRKLGRLRPQQAHGAQRAAAERLADIRRSLQQARQPRERAGQRQHRDRVEIPDAEAFAPPKAFRQELLEAMKEPAPSGYEPMVEQYYRELVR